MTRRPRLMFDVVAREKRHLRLLMMVTVFCSWAPTLPMLAAAPRTAPTGGRTAGCVRWGEIPLSFEPNLGQEPPEVRYLARGSSYTLYLADTAMLLSGNSGTPLAMSFVRANPAPRIVGESQQVSTSNYLIGNDPGRWRTLVPNYDRARYREVYPGIDLVYYGHDGNLEYDWIVSPSADPRRIRLRFDNGARPRVDEQGDLVIALGTTEYRHKKPLVYQNVDGRRVEISGAWRLHGREAGFRIARYDRRRPLIIDPVLYYSTYLGGSGLDYAYAVAVDGVGNTYVTGGTGSANFPTVHALQNNLRGSVDVFVTKINASGSARLYSTFLGSGGVDEGRGIAVNSRGEVYVTGSAGFSDFPMQNAIQGTWGGSGDAFLTKLDATGSALVYSTYLGGNAADYATALTLDSSGNAYVAGVTFSSNFPTVSAYQAAKGAQQDAFVAKINPAGSAWVYATYLGGNSVDEAYGIAADSAGNAYVAGYTQSTNFPVQLPFRGSNTGAVDAFVTKLNPAGSALVYSTYLGGSATDYATAIAVDASGSAYVTGIVTSDDFPLANPIDDTLGSHAVDDVFVSKFTPSGSGLVYSTYLGGGSGDDAYAIALDRSGNAYVTGRTNSSDFPLVNPIQITRVAFDLFVTEINASGSALLFSTFIGGSGSESGRGIAVDSLGNIHIAGESTSTDFPVLKATQATSAGLQDGIVLLFATRLPYLFNDFAGNGCSDGEVIYDSAAGQAYTALSNGDGTYSYHSSAVSSGFDVVRTGDVTGDGKADLLLYNSQTAAAYIGVGNGDGSFGLQALFVSPGYDFVETGDLDGDGRTDLVLYNSHTGTMYTGISTGNGNFTFSYIAVSAGFSYARVADFSGDGKADLFLYRWSDGLSFLGVADGAGGFTFAPVSLAAGYGLIDAGDLNGDGRADLILYNSTNGLTATGISNGAGGFALTPMLFSPGFTSVRLADYSGDGYADVTAYNSSNAAAYIGIGTGTGSFTFQSLFWSPGYDNVIPEDVNCDGKVDVILYNSVTGTEYTGISSGNGTFNYTYAYWGLGRMVVDQNHPFAAYLTAPAITEAPLSRTVNPGSLVTFSAAADAQPPPQVQWQVSVDGGTTYGNIAGATARTYSFVATVADNNKRFRAVFSNPRGAQTAGPATLGVRSVFRAATRADFDGDGFSDVMVWRPSSGTWYSLTSASGFTAGVSRQWGNSSLGDKPFQADIDGDGIADLIVWRPSDGTWYWVTSSTDYAYTSAGARQWGNSSLGDVPMVGDVDGDGRADLIVWRASTGTWYWLTSSSGYSYNAGGGIQWGNPGLGDQPVLGDYDGDGKADLAVWRASTGTWYWLTSSSNYSYASAHGIQWGNSSLGDKVITGDIDGDGKADLILWRPTDGTWYWLTSSTNYAYVSGGAKQWGNNGLGDVPMIGDFDGDHRADLAIWRSSSGTWYWLTSSSGYSYSSAIGRQWGNSSDTPMVK